MINIQKGNIIIPNYDNTIGKGLRKCDLMNSKFYADYLHSVEDTPKPYCWFSFKPVNMLDYSIRIETGFNRQKLDILRIRVVENDSLPYEDGSIEIETLRKQKNDEFLQMLAGKPAFINTIKPYPLTVYKFSWGEIKSILSPLSATSFIDFLYQ
ncbi:MAG: hypothetical protein N2484_00955 [Clostridia bacterium]|nr:hypothetical protein [Clostridia bacterium]